MLRVLFPGRDSSLGTYIILTILGNMHRIVEQLCDGLAAARIAGQQAIAANIAFDTMDMELLIKLLHGEKLPSFLQHYTAVLQFSSFVLSYYSRLWRKWQPLSAACRTQFTDRERMLREALIQSAKVDGEKDPSSAADDLFRVSFVIL